MRQPSTLHHPLNSCKVVLIFGLIGAGLWYWVGQCYSWLTEALVPLDQFQLRAAVGMNYVAGWITLDLLVGIVSLEHAVHCCVPKSQIPPRVNFVPLLSPLSG